MREREGCVNLAGGVVCVNEKLGVTLCNGSRMYIWRVIDAERFVTDRGVVVRGL